MEEGLSGDRKPLPITLSQLLTEPAPALVNAELQLAFHLARTRLLDALDAELAKIKAELRGVS